MRTFSPLALAVLGVTLLVSGCGAFRGPPDPLVERAERLRVPPDLRADAFSESMAVPERPAGEPSASAPELRVQLASEGDAPMLLLEADFFQSWRMVGLALDRAGFTVEDRDRTRGAYYIRYDARAEAGQQERGFFASLAFWRDDEPDSLQPYVINLGQADAGTRVVVTDENGDAPEPETAERILELVREHLR